MKRLFLVFAIVIGYLHFVNAQQIKGKDVRFWLYFKDKGPEAAPMPTDFRILLPEAMVNAHLQRSLPIDKTDLPVSETYIRQLTAAGYTLKGSSRWLNAVSVSGTDITLEKVKKACPSVYAIRFMPPALMIQDEINTNAVQQDYKEAQADTFLRYGQAFTQDTMINIQCLHNQGFTGSGVKMAILDDGFYGINSCKVFNYLNSTNHVKARYNLTDSSQNIDVGSGHGTAVSSTIVSNEPGFMIGTAFDADIYLEAVAQAGSADKDLRFIASVEWADEQGVDIIQSSLGFFYPQDSDSIYGNPGYEFDSLNGHSTPVTRVAEMAVAKGIIFVNALGNKEYGYTRLFAPSDGDSVLSVGGVDRNGQYHTGSSVGPTADGRIKPDVAALSGEAASSGYGMSCQITSLYSGTSFSAPLISGMAACLKQAHPNATGWQIVQAIKQSGRQYPLKDTMVGYGIPDACKADSILSTIASINGPVFKNNRLKVYPVPALNTINVTGVTLYSKMKVFDELGNTIKVNFNALDSEHVTLDIKDIAPGIYLLQVTGKDAVTQTAKFIKYN